MKHFIPILALLGLLLVGCEPNKSKTEIQPIKLSTAENQVKE